MGGRVFLVTPLVRADYVVPVAVGPFVVAFFAVGGVALGLIALRIVGGRS